MFRKCVLTIVLSSMLINAYGEPTTQENPIIKAGTIAFARLNTRIDSNHPSIVTATLLDGKYKGAQLRGQLIKSSKKSPKSIRFTLLCAGGKEHTLKRINAYAIDYDAARTAIVTEVDVNYLKQHSLSMATAFITANKEKNKLIMGAGSDFGLLFITDVS